MQEPLSRFLVRWGKFPRTGWRLEQILVEVAFLFQSFHAFAQVGDRLGDAVKFLGVHLDGFTGQRRAPPPLDDLGGGRDEDQRDNERKNPTGILSAIRGYCTDESNAW